MAVATHLRTNIILLFETGLNEYGKPILKRVNLSSARGNMTADEIWDLGFALSSLSKHSLFGIERAVTHSIDY